MSEPAFATGALCTTIVCVIVSAPKPLFTISVAVYVPPEVHSTCGFCRLLDVGFPPEKLQLQEVGAGDDKSEKTTES